MSAELSSFGKFIREIRGIRGAERGKLFFQAELCRELGVGDDPPSVVSRIEADKQFLSKDFYERLGLVLGFTLETEGPYSQDRANTSDTVLKRNKNKFNSRTSYDSFGAFLAELRFERGYISQKELAEATGISHVGISNIEGDKYPTIKSDTIDKLMEVLAFTPEDKRALIMKSGRKAVKYFEPLFGTKMKQLRDEKGLSQMELGKMLGYEGLNPANMVSLMERGVSNPTRRVRKKLEEILSAENEQ